MIENINKENIINESENTKNDNKESKKESEHEKEHEKHKQKSKEIEKEIKKLEEEIKNLTEKYEKLSNEKDEWYNSFLRKAAEFDNYKKRVAKEMENMKIMANKDLLLKIIPIFDNFKRAIDSASDNQNFNNLYEGLRISYSELSKVFEDIGLKPIESIGKEFNPELHEVLMIEETDDENKNNIVLQEFERGYILGNTVIKHSKVKVAKYKNNNNNSNNN